MPWRNLVEGRKFVIMFLWCSDYRCQGNICSHWDQIKNHYFLILVKKSKPFKTLLG